MATTTRRPPARSTTSRSTTTRNSTTRSTSSRTKSSRPSNSRPSSRTTSSRTTSSRRPEIEVVRHGPTAESMLIGSVAVRVRVSYSVSGAIDGAGSTGDFDAAGSIEGPASRTAQVRRR